MNTNKPLEVIIYTDGAAKGNPGKGGYGVVLISGEHRKELSGGFRLTTNNRMELLAAIVGLEALKKNGCKVTIFSDSKYFVEAVNKGWIFNWIKINFKDKKNPDLWLKFMELYKKHDIKINWVPGHANIKENEVCDKLAVKAAESQNLLIDQFYENNHK